MSADLLRACILAATGAVENAKDELCRLDAAAGDGDHGVTMALGARGVRQQLAASPDVAGADLVTKVALAMGSVGGAIGPIYATGLLAVATTMRKTQPAGTSAVGLMSACAVSAEEAASKLGGAAPGNKTVLDAMHPAVVSLGQAQDAGASAGDALETAARAARIGADSTAEMAATLGRASRLGERSRGLADPGATSLAIILEALAAAYVRETSGPRSS